MLNGGIYDHVGGGLCRYSTDAEWLVPHFEKMLYDNAHAGPPRQLGLCGNRRETFRDRIEATIAWLLREMRVEGGGFAASLDADSGGEEGAFYTWDRSEVESVLGADAAYSSRPTRCPRPWLGRQTHHPSEQLGRNRCRAGPAAGEDCSQPRKTAYARPRRQGAGRLERPGDRRAC